MVGFQCRDSLFVHNYLIIECLSFLPVLIQQSSGFSVGSLSVPLHVKPLFSWVSLMVSFFWNMIFNQSFYLVLTKFEVSQVQYVLLTNNVCMAPNFACTLLLIFAACDIHYHVDNLMFVFPYRNRHPIKLYLQISNFVVYCVYRLRQLKYYWDECCV